MGRDNASDSKQSQIRLNKLIADSGLASRRNADRLISEGEVIVNGKKVYELGIKVDPTADKIIVSGKPLKHAPEKIYIMLNKPRGVLTTMSDPEGRPTVADFVEDLKFRVFPVGRLDWDSEGLLLLTNDGEWANKITHPKDEVTKTYMVKLDGEPTKEQLFKLVKGVTIVGGKASAKHIEKVKVGDSKKYSWYKVIIAEGKNRQIRQMFLKIGFDVLKLQRVAIGRLRMGSLERGEKVFLNEVAAERVFLQDNPVELQEKLKAKRAKAAARNTRGPRKDNAKVSAYKQQAKKNPRQSAKKDIFE